MIQPLDKEQKVTILLSALEERYKSQHTIRERVQSIGVWALGLMVAAGGWIIQSKITLNLFHKGIYILGILAAFIVLLKYLNDLNIGFRSQQNVAVRLEKTLGLFSIGEFDNESDSIYPQKWENAGKKEGGGKFFHTTYLLLYVGVGFLIASILFSGNFYQCHDFVKYRSFPYQTSGLE